MTVAGVDRTGFQAGFTAEERAVVRALAFGGTDETVARRLGVSPRTLRRRIATVMVHLDATSRFQAGAEAAQAGLIPRDERRYGRES